MQATVSVALAVGDAATGISSMVSDVKTIFSGNASLLDKVLAGGDLLLNVAMDVSMVVGLGEGIKAAYVGMKAAGHLAEEAAVHAGTDAATHVLEHEGEDAAEHAAEDAAKGAAQDATDNGPRRFWRKGSGGEPPKGSDLITEDRPGRSADIKPDENGMMQPNPKKGYSVFDKPGHFGNADEWYYATEDDLPDELKLTWNERPNDKGYTHGNIGVSSPMPQQEMERLFDQIPWRQ